MSFKKRASKVLALTLIGVSVATPILNTVSAVEKSNNTVAIDSEYVAIDSETMDNIIIETAQQIMDEAPQRDGSVREKRTVGFAISIAKKLGKKMGKKYITTKLPRQIYKAMVRAVPKVAFKVSEGQFVTFFNTYILMGPLDGVKDSVSNYLDNYMPKWMADSAGYAAQGVIWAII